MVVSKSFGARIARVEDPRLITGKGSFIEDINVVNSLHMAVLRSPYAHARIKSVDASKALGRSGVVKVLTGEEVQQRSKYLQLGWDASASGSKVPRRYALAVGKVRYVGEPVAAVVATDKYTARDALELIQVDYEPLPTVVDPEKAMDKDAPILHEDLGTNVTWSFKINGGDVDKAFREADVVVKERLVNQRLIPVAMEPRGVVANFDAGTGDLTVWTATQIPHLLRKLLSFTLDIPENRIRVIAPDVGGGFGSKLNFYPEEALTSIASMILGSPVKWIEERNENMQNAIHGRDITSDVEAAFKKDGTILGLRCNAISDVGAYYMHLTPVMPTLVGFMLEGCYKLPSIFFEIKIVLTNKMAMDAYRGAGRPEPTFIIERVMDLAAKELGIDPADIRLKNFIPNNEFPYNTITGLAYDSGDYSKALNKVLELADYRKFREEQKQAWQQGEYIGIGLSSYVEICGWGPSGIVEAVYPKRNNPVGTWEYGAIRFDPSGRVTVETGTSPHGQGHETTWAQIVSDELGIPMNEIVVVHGDTEIVPYGVATYASRSGAVGGAAVFMSAQKIKEKALKIAANMMEARLEDLVYDSGTIHVKGTQANALTIREVAEAAYVAAKLPAGMEPGLEARNFYNPPNFTFPFGTIAVVVEVDPGSGVVKLLKYVSVDDCGNVINPMIVEGQIHGGAAQGLAQALYEEAIYDDDGQLLTGSLTDYFVPTAVEIPRFTTDRTVTPTPSNPMGVKGIGETATIGSPPAVVNAVVDALSPLGVKHIDMPLKPEKIWKILRDKGVKE